MAVETIKKRTAAVLVDNGTDTQGNHKTATVNISGISSSGWDADKFLAVAGALEQCLSNTLYSTQTVATYTVAAS